MQVSWSPIASWISTAATDESTPPDRPQITRPPPDLRADARDLGVAEAGHGPVAAAAGDVVGEVAQQLRAVRRVHDLGVELHAVEAPRVVGDGGERRALAAADAAEAGRQAVTRSPWLIHTCSRAPCSQTPWNSAQSSVTSTKARPNSRWSRALHLAAELRAHRLLAVADAEHRHARLEHDRRAARGASSSVTLAGPPERMMARGANAAMRAGLGVERPDLAIDAALAHAPGDQLRDLAAEIEDQHAVGGELGGLGHAACSTAVGLRRKATWSDIQPWSAAGRRPRSRRRATEALAAAERRQVRAHSAASSSSAIAQRSAASDGGRSPLVEAATPAGHAAASPRVGVDQARLTATRRQHRSRLDRARRYRGSWRRPSWLDTPFGRRPATGVEPQRSLSAPGAYPARAVDCQIARRDACRPAATRHRRTGPPLD